MVTFPVDDVTPAPEALPTSRLGELFQDALVIGGDPALPVLEPDGVHPLLSAVGRAFAEHRPLVLSPDAVWLTIAQGVAQHVRLHAEQLRPLLVTHSGRKRLSVKVFGPMPSDPDSWHAVIGDLHKLLSSEIEDPGRFDCDFTTSTEVERVAGRVVLLDAYSPYFALWLVTVCGIPSITLTGTVADWRKIRERVDTIAVLGLEKWCRSLAAITDQFVRAASGEVDTAFWRRIYNPVDAYGGDVITGWAARFYPYLTVNGVTNAPNPLLDLEIGHPRDGAGAQLAIRTDNVPSVLSRVNVNLTDLVTQENSVVSVHAGLVAVAQDADRALRPVVGWHVAPATIEMDDVIDRIKREHETTEPGNDGMLNGCVEMIALYSRIGSAALFGGDWLLLPAGERTWVTFGHAEHSLNTLFGLSDGRTLCAVTDFFAETTSHWALCRVEPESGAGALVPRSLLLDDPREVPVYMASLAMILEAALDSGGDISHMQTGWLSEL